MPDNVGVRTVPVRRDGVPPCGTSGAVRQSWLPSDIRQFRTVRSVVLTSIECPALPRVATPLTEGSIFVRPFEFGDVAAVTAACQDREISRWTAAIPWPYREEHASGWILTHGDLWERGEGAEFAITRAPTDDFVGAVGLRPIDWKNRKAVAGYWVAAWARNDGVATKALTLVTGWAFQHVGLQVVELETMIGNRASERGAEKAGFDLVATVSDAEHPIAEGKRFNVKRWALRQA